MLKIISKKLEFDAHDLLKENWREEIFKAQDENKITFDLENDDTRGDAKTIKCKDDQSYIVQLCSAGGDWESPVLYFRIQVKDGYPSRKMLVFIPSKDEGNGNLAKGKKGLVPLDADGGDKNNLDETKAWKAVKKYLESWHDKNMENL